jgi:hypothetical protein
VNYDNLDDITVFVKSNWHENSIPFWDLIEKCSQYDYMNVGRHPENSIDYSNPLEYTTNDDRIEKRTIWYRHIFGDEIEKPNNVKVWGHGPCFSVSRKLIMRHPKSVYEYLLDRMIIPYKNKECDEKLLKDIQIIYHNEFQRFYTLLFTHNLMENEKNYKIYPNSSIPDPDNINNNNNIVYMNPYSYKNITNKNKFEKKEKFNYRNFKSMKLSTT